MPFDIREKALEVVFDGVLVMLNENVLQFGELKVELKDTRKG